MLKRRIRNLAVSGITIVAAISFATLSATGARAASAAPTATASTCVEIQIGNTGYQIWDNGPYKPVWLVKAPGSCWHHVYPSYAWWGGQEYTGWQYQDLRGDCLWDNGGIIYTTPACGGGKSYQTFYGLNYYHNGHNSPGWIVTDGYFGPRDFMDTAYSPHTYANVFMSANNDTEDSHFWNFP